MKTNRNLQNIVNFDPFQDKANPKANSDYLTAQPAFFDAPTNTAKAPLNKTEAPGELSCLARDDQTTIAALRRWSMGWNCNDPRQWSRMHRDLVDEIGLQSARMATAAIIAMATILARRAETFGDGDYRRPRPACHPPCCPYLSSWEVTLAGFLAAVRAGCRRTLQQKLLQLASPCDQADLLLWTNRLLASLQRDSVPSNH